MAEYTLVKISELPELTMPQDLDFFEVLSGGANRKVKLSTLRTKIGLTDAQREKLDQLPDNTALETELDSKVDKDGTKVLSDNNYTTDEKQKLADLPTKLALDQTMATKVDKVAGYGLSKNDYTDADKTKVANAASTSDVNTAVANKVDKEAGKGLSTNDYTDVEKQKLANTVSQTELTTGLGGKVDKDGTKVLSDNNFTTIQKDKLDALPTNAALDSSLNAKVDKEAGKGLSSNDFTTVEKQKLANTASQTDLSNGLSGKVDKDGTKVLSDNNYTTAEKDKLSALPTNAALNTSLGNKVDKVAGKGLSTNDYTTAEKDKLGALPTSADLNTSLGSKVNISDVGTESNQIPVNGMLGNMAFMDAIGVTYLTEHSPELIPGTTWKQKNGTGFDEYLVNPSGVLVDITGTKRANHTGTQAISTVTGLQTALDAKAPLASPALTGTPSVPNLKLGNVASTDAFTLDYYEEGSWTPTLTAATPGDMSISYATQVGRYTRIGNICTVDFRLSFTPTFTTASGDLRVEGLPFTSMNVPGINYVGYIFTGNFNLPANAYITTASIGSNISRIGLITSAISGAPVAIRVEDALTSGRAATELRCTLTYKVA